jgi:Zn2+/Cd2+-exporting ATPase
MSRATTTAGRRRYRVVEGSCLDCAGDVAGTLLRVAGVRDVRVLPAAELVLIDGDPDDDAVAHAAATLGISLTLQRAAAPIAATAIRWWQQPQMLAVLAAAGLWLAGFAVEQLTRVESLAVGLYWATLLVGGWYPSRSAWQALRSRRLTISTLLVVAAAGAVALGVVGEAALLVVVFSLGEVLEEYATGKARGALRALMDLAPDQARRRRLDRGVETVPADQLMPGDVVLVRPGDRIPTDGRVVSGYSTVNQSSVTGESLPVEATVGSEVFAGSINGVGALEVETAKPYEDTTLARVIRPVQEAQTAKGQAQRFADRFGAVYTPAMFALAITVAALPPLLGADVREWAYRALVVLVVSCSCALVISVPTAVVAAITRAARDGILIKGGVHLETLGRVRAIAVDKTGTLTASRPGLTDVVAAPGTSREEVLRLAAAVEAASEHPLAGAIVRGARDLSIEVTPATGLRATPGVGVEATIEDRTLFVGRPTSGSGWGADRVAELEARGRTAVIVAEGNDILGVVAVADQMRPEAPAIIAQLGRLGVDRVVMLTGDNDRVAAAIANRVGIHDWRAGLRPEDKTAAVTQLRQRYVPIAMVGDGVNDAPALATADVGVAMGAAGSDAALETADVALMSDDLHKLPQAIAHARRALANLRQNVALSLFIVVTLVAAALTGRLSLTAGFLLNEVTALAVIANGLRLLRPARQPETRPDPQPKEQDRMMNQQDQPEGVPACSAEAAEVLERASRLRRLASQALIDSRRTPAGAQFRLRNTPEVEMGVQEFVQWEADCCPFLDFSVDATSGEIRIDVHAPSEADAVLDLLVAVTAAPPS